MLTAHARGVYPIAPTPFHGDGCVNEGCIERLVEPYLPTGAAGATVLGALGEAPNLEPEESLAWRHGSSTASASCR